MKDKKKISLPAESANIQEYVKQYSEFYTALEGVGRDYIAGQFDDLFTAAMEQLESYLEQENAPADIKNLVHMLPVVFQVQNVLDPQEIKIDSSDTAAVIGVLVPFK